MNGPRIKALLLAFVGAGTIAALSGCDLNENADLAAGRELFTTNCGTCHALKEAATTAQIGPDLDASFAAARAAGMDQDTVEGVVTAQIESPREADPEDPTYMPPNILEGTEADNVSAYIASVAGVPGIEAPVAPGGPGGQVFASNGCGACHTLGAAESAGNVGPNLDSNLPGQAEDMIRQSIIAPDTEIVQGFSPGIMPGTYESSIPAKDLDLLVQFLAESAGKGSPAEGKPAASGG